MWSLVKQNENRFVVADTSGAAIGEITKLTHADGALCRDNWHVSLMRTKELVYNGTWQNCVGFVRGVEQTLAVHAPKVLETLDKLTVEQLGEALENNGYSGSYMLSTEFVKFNERGDAVYRTKWNDPNDEEDFTTGYLYVWRDPATNKLKADY